ncbi:hypothetical protein HN695_04945 [Candidatus Woesearchaeota archaeon]|jgi:hypothetical protein|nr:hypothetical protein [Candidatus Woesearchaeota archaeon]MBT5272070.1 hypothetical protein [Candidatus Woesearchaeota archaeon]MBT6041820.1 hypothetical protein [Candidatus Woesearchaeota archaeon]MBT6336805.1 hypothetical protein [Candidatus Woesearchaeota archaeon]MBT7927660.1 hypothetical protein [Candidatus Woesearchaeota archaeon]
MPKKTINSIPKSLRIWFLIHFIVDIIFAIPLIFFPERFLALFGILAVETVTPRLVGAALVGIGGASFFVRNKSKESYDIMLTLKILWSSAAIIALLVSSYVGAPKAIWYITGTFAVFSAIWWYYKLRIR